MHVTHKSMRLMLGLLGLALSLAYFSPRPALQTDPGVLTAGGSKVDYCDPAELDRQGKTAVQTPKGNTPGCGYRHSPWPIFAECREPVIAAAVDIRGLWQAVGGRAGHVERIE